MQARFADGNAARAKELGRLPRALALQERAVKHLEEAAELAPDDRELAALAARARAERGGPLARLPGAGGQARDLPPAAE